MGKLIDQVHFAVGFPPYDIATAIDNSTYLKGNAVNVKNYNHVTIVILQGTSAGATAAVSVRQAATAAGVVVGAAIVPIDYRYLLTQTSAESDTWVKTTVTANTWTIPATAQLSNVVEFDTAVLTAGLNWIGVNITAAGGGGLASCLYILSEPRYISAEDSPTAIA